MERATNRGFKDLHRLHTQLREVQGELDRGPRVLKARQQLIQQKQADLEAQKQKTKQLKMAADQKSLQLKTNEAKIADLRGKLNAAVSNREFDIIRSQIEADTVANSVLEDEILDALEKVDASQIAAHKLEEELAAAKADETRFAAETTAAEPGLKARLVELQVTLTTCESQLPAEVANKYQRLVVAYGADAMAIVDGAICSSCYVSLPPQMVVALKAGEILFCKTCGKLLYPGEGK